MIPYMVGKLAPNSSHLTRGFVKHVSGRDYFCAVPSQNGDKYVTSPPPQTLNLSKVSTYQAQLLRAPAVKRPGMFTNKTPFPR